MMKITPSIRFGAGFVIVLNLFMSFACIWIFGKMAPSVKQINDENERSLNACMKMLQALAMLPEAAKGEDLPDRGKSHVPPIRESFEKALTEAKNACREPGEIEQIRAIAISYPAVFRDDLGARDRTTKEILLLANINREAMIQMSMRIRDLGVAGAWCVVFMAIFSFVSGLLFLRTLDRSLIRPINELESTLQAHRNGDSFRRCSEGNPPPDIRRIYEEVNALLDQSTRLDS